MGRQQLRLLSRVILMVLITLHVTTWYFVGVHAVGSIGIEALFSGLSRGFLNAGFVFWIVVFGSALLLGRAFCAWFCWFGGYLELVEWAFLRLRINPPRPTLLHLGAIPFVALGIKVYGSLLVNWLNGFPSRFVFRLADVEPWGGQQTGISILITLVLFGPVLLVVFGRRAWCRHLCPIGALLKVFGLVSLGRMRLVNDDCVACGACNRACDMQVDVMGELRSHGEVRSSDCIRCLKCTDDCPKAAIELTMTTRKSSLSVTAAQRAKRASAGRRQLSLLDVTIVGMWAGVILTANLVGFRQTAPQEIRVLMTPGLLLVIYGFVIGARRAWLALRNRG